jgi:hypothetical protein
MGNPRGHSLVLLESQPSIDESDLIEFMSQFSELKVWKKLIFEWILLLKIQTN